MAGRRHKGPLRVQRSFHPEGAPCHAYILHPPGGVVGGDSLRVNVNADPHAWALLTSPGATKFYRSLGRNAQFRQTLKVASGAVLEWFPQEQIIFSGAKVDSLTRLDLQSGSRSIAWELSCLGRPAGRLPFRQGVLRQRLEVWREGLPQLLEHARLRGGQAVLDSPWGLGGCQAFATLVAAPADFTDLSAVREVLSTVDGECAVTLLDDLLVLRWRGAGSLEGYLLRDRVWEALRPRLLGRPVCRPRIWNT